MDLLRIVIAVLLPPLGVFLQVGIGKHFWINILLTILGYVPASSTRCGSSRSIRLAFVCLRCPAGAA